MKLHELSPAPGSVREVKRIGRGHGSGQGKTAGKGHKGQKARAGRGIRPGFPKRGFNNIFATEYAILNGAALNAFEDGAVVDLDAAKAAGLVKKGCDGLKVLGNGALQKKLTVKAAAFSEAAKAKIEAAGGKAEVI